jgi:adenylate cyclase
MRIIDAMEIERKYLVNKLPKVEPVRIHHIEQGYIVITKEGNELRVRNKSDQFTLTVKTVGGLSRDEIEFNIMENDFRNMWSLTQNRRVTKDRMEVMYGKYRIEIDKYSGHHAGLIIAEIEFATTDDALAFDPPKWFGKEVTDYSRYKNQWLAQHGLPK